MDDFSLSSVNMISPCNIPDTISHKRMMKIMMSMSSSDKSQGSDTNSSCNTSLHHQRLDCDHGAADDEQQPQQPQPFVIHREFLNRRHVCKEQKEEERKGKQQQRRKRKQQQQRRTRKQQQQQRQQEQQLKHEKEKQQKQKQQQLPCDDLTEGQELVQQYITTTDDKTGCNKDLWSSTPSCTTHSLTSLSSLSSTGTNQQQLEQKQEKGDEINTKAMVSSTSSSSSSLCNIPFSPVRRRSTKRIRSE